MGGNWDVIYNTMFPSDEKIDLKWTEDIFITASELSVLFGYTNFSFGGIKIKNAIVESKNNTITKNLKIDFPYFKNVSDRDVNVFQGILLKNKKDISWRELLFLKEIIDFSKYGPEVKVDIQKLKVEKLIFPKNAYDAWSKIS